MKRFAQVTGALLLLWTIYRPITHFLCLPRTVHSSWVQPLATISTSYHHQSELFTGGEDARKLYQEAEPVFKANDQKRHLYATLNSGTGSFGLFGKYSTVEGDPIFEWLLVQDGKLTYVKDSSRDGGAPPWAIYTCTPLNFKLGFMRQSKFVEGEPSPKDSPVIVFQLKVHNQLVSRQVDEHYFY